MKNIIIKISLIIALIIFANSCRHWDNFITYFNTYYNADRIMKESEMEFSYFEEKTRVMPRVIVPEPDIFVQSVNSSGPPPFMEEFIIRKHKRQPVEVKLDSIIIKGSKILAHHPKSNYIQGTLYLMAKSYFYQEEWLPSQIKCIELIDRFPDGEYSPDAHLLLSENLLIQRKFEAGKIMLSRTVDIAWQLQRFDILAIAFRLEADLALYQGDKEGALKPYKQAIVQSEDRQMKAKWQVELASLLYRMSDFEKAAVQFKKARDFSPDYLAEFESYLYEGASYARLGKYEEAEDIFDDLYTDGKYEEWQGAVAAQKLNLYRIRTNLAEAEQNESDTLYTEQKLIGEERNFDSMFVNDPSMIAYYYERAMDKFYDDEYAPARNYFNKSRITRTPVYEHSKQMFDLTNTWQLKHASIKPIRKAMQQDSSKTVNDSLMNIFSGDLFVLGRTHEQLGNQDSALYYYKLSAENAPLEYEESSRYLYAYSRTVKTSDPYTADSLLEVIVNTHPLTPYGEEAREQLGYTDAFVIDTVKELYNSGTRLRKFGDYYFAINQFLEIYTKYPNNEFAPKALYAIGWIYEERDYPDLAHYYYKLLLDEYPHTEYARDIRLTVAYMDAIAAGGPLPDSLKEKKIQDIKIVNEEDRKFKPDPSFDPSLQPGHQVEDADPKEFLKNPKSLFEKGKNLFKNPKEMLKQIEMPSKEEMLELPKMNIDAEKTDENKNNEQIPDSTGKKK